MTLHLIGSNYGRLTVIATKRVMNRTICICICACDESKFVEIRADHLLSGKSQSCGCLRKEVMSQTMLKHGAHINRKAQPIYKIWQNMKERCNRPANKRYNQYGGRGIRVCDEWNTSFEAFRDYMLSLPNCPVNVEAVGAKLDRQIDRYPNNDGHYEPGNVRWGTLADQANNKSSNRIVVVNGVKMSLSQAVEKHGKASYHTIHSRLERGWSMKKAFLTPV